MDVCTTRNLVPGEGIKHQWGGKASFRSELHVEEKCFSLKYLIHHTQSDLILLLLFSTKIVAHVHLEFTADLCIPKRYTVLCICSKLFCFSQLSFEGERPRRLLHFSSLLLPSQLQGNIMYQLILQLVWSICK